MMKKELKFKSLTKGVIRISWWLIAIWTIILSGLLVYDLISLKSSTQNLAIIEARAHFQKDEAFRFWTATHGGFYVPISKRTSPSHYLSHVFERDIETPSGVKLTLMNPAWSLRQMNEDFKESYGISGHITSLLPLRPENAPDDWEKQALKLFEKGETEVVEFIDFEGKSSLRLMQPLITQEGCLKCHAHQGYKVGDIRGGVSISVPLTDYLSAKKNATNTHLVSFVLTWILGCGLIILGSRTIKKNIYKREQTQLLLKKSYNQLDIRVNERTAELADSNKKLHIEIVEHKQAEAAVIAATKIINRSPIVAFLWKNEEGWPVEYVSDNVEKLLGYSKQEFIDGTINYSKIIHKDDIFKVNEEVSKFSNNKSLQSFTHEPYRIITKNGEIKWLNDITFIIRDAKGEITHYEGIVYDFTDQKQAKEALEISKNKYQSLFDNMLDSFALHKIVLNEDGIPIDYIFIEVNDAFELQTGLKREKIIGKKVTEVLPGIENDETGWIEIYGKVALTGEGIKFESFSKPIDKWYLINTYSPKKGYFATIFEDITKRKQAETEIIKLSAAVEQSANTIVISDIKGNIEYVNPVFTKLTGYSAKEALGQNPRILNAGTQPKEYYAEMWQTISVGKIWEGEFHNKTKNGNFFWEHVIITPLKNDDGIITNYLAVKENITDRKKAELKLKESEEQLRELNTTKDKFFSIIAHDLRSPFNSILGFSELILENSKRNDFSNTLKMSTILNDTVNKSFDLLNNLLEWSRVQTDRITFMPDNHQLSILIVEVVKLLSLAAMKKNIKVDFEVSDIEIKIDVNMIQTVLRNLLSNAIKYSHKGGLINISAFENKNEVEISVKDNGVGINKDYMEKLFLLGENIATLGTDNEKGTGLGLILCKEFVEKHKGKIWVKSEEGKGSEFKFILPKKM